MPAAHGEGSEVQPMKNFTVSCGPGTMWKVRVKVWPSHKRLIEERRKIEERSCNDPLAFFHDFTSNRQLRTKYYKDSMAGEIHFFKGKGLTRANIIHESTHAAVAFGFLCRLNIDNRYGEEEFVKSVTHIACGVMFGLRKKNP